MSLYRLMARDRLADVEVRPCDQPDIGSQAATGCAAAKPLREVAYDSLDLVDLGHHLLLIAAQEKAQSIIAEAGKQAQRLHEEARQSGRQEGREEAKQEVLPALIAFGDAGQSLIVFEERLIDRCTAQIVRLAVEIAEKVIGHAVEAEPELVASVLERAKREVTEAKQIRIWLNPADHQILAEYGPELVKTGCENGRTIEVVTSEEVSRGGCRLETEMGLIDATLPTQIEEIRRQLSDKGQADNFGVYASDSGRS